MVVNQPRRFVPGWKELILVRARSRVSCTRSSTRSMLRQRDIAKARKPGIADRISSRVDGAGAGRVRSAPGARSTGRSSRSQSQSDRRLPEPILGLMRERVLRRPLGVEPADVLEAVKVGGWVVT